MKKVFGLIALALILSGCTAREEILTTKSNYKYNYGSSTLVSNNSNSEEDLNLGVSFNDVSSSSTDGSDSISVESDGINWGEIHF